MYRYNKVCMEYVKIDIVVHMYAYMDRLMVFWRLCVMQGCKGMQCYITLSNSMDSVR